MINFYCQSEIEGRFECDKQCKHCEEYYKPIEHESQQINIKLIDRVAIYQHRMSEALMKLQNIINKKLNK